MGTTEKLAEFLVNTSYEEIPPRIRNFAKRMALDTLGVAMAGTPEVGSGVLSNLVKGFGAAPEAGVIGKGFRTAAPLAGLVNGTMTNTLDYDDCGIKIGHPSTLVLPAVISLGDQLGAPGEEILAAYILGLEVQGKVSLGCNLAARPEGITHFVFLGGLGAAAAACRLLKLDVRSTRVAFAIATNLACGLSGVFHGTWLGGIKAGNAAYNGIMGALLAQEGAGLPANLDIVECAGGLCDTFVGPGNYDLDVMTRNLGDPFYIEQPGVTFKKYPSCFITHRALEAALQLLADNGIRYEDIAEVEVGITKRAERTLCFPDPRSGHQGKFSMPYCVASALVDRKVNLNTFDEEKVHEPRVREAMTRVRLFYSDLPIFSGLSQVDPTQPPPVGNPVTVRLKDGRSYSARVDTLRGSPEAPLTDDELLAKYTECAGRVLSPPEIERSAQLILNLERVPNFREIMDIMCLTGGGER